MEAPPGGPADTKRPFVAAVLPAPDALHISQDLQVQIAFSEWVGADIERGKVYLNPPLTKKVKSKLTGNLLKVTSQARLDTGTTYLMGILSSVKDLNGLSLESPLELVFSTGGTLDSGKISGRVAPFQGKRGAGSMVALYPRGVELRSRFSHLTHKGDSLIIPEAQPNPTKEQPTYLAPADSLGHFSFRALRPGRYGLLGFQDINANLKPEIGVEALGIGPILDITTLGDSKTLTLFAYDTVPVKLMEAKWVNEIARGRVSDGTIRLKFSRSPHPLFSQIRDFYSVHRVGQAGNLAQGIPVPVLEVCLHPLTNEVELHTVPLDIDSQYVVACQGLKDPYGNPMDTARSRAPFRVNGNLDTARADMIVFGPRKVNGEPERIGSDRLIPSRGLALYYPRVLTDSVFKDLKTRLVIKLDTTPISVNLVRANHHEFAVMLPSLQLKGQRLQFGLIPISDSLKSVAFATFTLADSAKLGTLKFQQQSSAFGSHLVLRSLSSPTEFSRLSTNSAEFLWDSLPEGWYALDYFRDANGDGIWNPGSLAPWSVQEPYVMWMDSVEVKPAGVSNGSGTTSRKLAWPPEW